MKNQARFWFTFPRSLPTPAAGLILTVILTPLSLLLSSCASSPEPQMETTASYGAGYPAGSAGWTEKQRVLYRAAFDAGRRDQREGYRVTVPLDVDLKSFSRQGYRAGYYYDAARRRAARTAAASGSADPIPGGPSERPFSDSHSGSPFPATSGMSAPPPAPAHSDAAPGAKPPVKRQGGDPFAIPLEGEMAPETPSH